MSHAKAIVLVSGGLDSFVTAARAREDGRTVLALTIDYNQRHRIELDAAAQVAAAVGAERHVVLSVDLSAFGGSALTSEVAVPKTGVDGTIPVTYVPARNTIFLSLALGWAEAAGARDLYVGINALDYSGYPDCRPEFVGAFEAVADLATKAGVEGERFKVRAPLLNLGKADIAREANRLGLDVGISWSCYDPVPGPASTSASKSEFGGTLHCGLCDSCRLRRAGFSDAGLRDPTRYASASVRP